MVREHYPAFSVAEHGTFRVDEYQGFHSDIFVHRDGHAVIGNQVLVSVLAAIPLFVFDPILDRLEAHSKSVLATSGVADAEYRTDKPMRVEFFRLVKERGLDLRFGAATTITTVFFMAPITALFLVFFYGVLRQRGLDRDQATGLTFLLGFGTPIFFRTTGLNHNMFVLYFSFAAFALLWLRRDDGCPVSLRRRLLAGLCGGAVVATDYIGVVILPVLYAYLVIPRLRSASWHISFKESLAMVAGSLPAIAFLLFSQWAMYGNPFLPGQYWMPDQNAYTNEGMRGFTLPDAELLLQNLFHPGFGMYVWGPVLLLALVPVDAVPGPSVGAAQTRAMVRRRHVRRGSVVLARSTSTRGSNGTAGSATWSRSCRCSCWRSPTIGFACREGSAISIASAVLLHSWVLTVFREPVPRSWQLFLTEGPAATMVQGAEHDGLTRQPPPGALVGSRDRAGAHPDDRRPDLDRRRPPGGAAPAP